MNRAEIPIADCNFSPVSVWTKEGGFPQSWRQEAIAEQTRKLGIDIYNVTMFGEIWEEQKRMLEEFAADHGAIIISGGNDLKRWGSQDQSTGITLEAVLTYDNSTHQDIDRMVEHGALGFEFTWVNSNDLASAQREKVKGLTEKGKGVVKHLGEIGKPCFIDVSHLNAQSIKDIFNIAAGYRNIAILASHSNSWSVLEKMWGQSLWEAFEEEMAKLNGKSVLGLQNLNDDVLKLFKDYPNSLVCVFPWLGSILPSKEWLGRQDFNRSDFSPLLLHLAHFLVMVGPDKIGWASDIQSIPWGYGDQFMVSPDQDTPGLDLGRSWVDYLLNTFVQPDSDVQLKLKRFFGDYPMNFLSNNQDQAENMVRGVVHDNFVNFLHKLLSNPVTNQ